MSGSKPDEGIYSGTTRVTRNVSVLELFRPPSRFLSIANLTVSPGVIREEDDDEEKGLLSSAAVVENSSGISPGPVF